MRLLLSGRLLFSNGSFINLAFRESRAGTYRSYNLPDTCARRPNLFRQAIIQPLAEEKVAAGAVDQDGVK